ncbi:DUF2490 domain-containing protein [Oscillatoria amoena NRMC-F 0135]|nr:DUF2490 domain-containing protein [Oscillatoria amoena NRMC-F 0135]
MIRKLVLFFPFLLLSISLCAQKEIVSQYNGWYMYFGNHRLTDRFSLHTEYQWRRADWITAWQQSLLRLGVDYKLTDTATFTAGYGHILTWPYGEQPLPEKFLEHRAWEQLMLTQRVGRFFLNHRYRLEQRWLKGNGSAASDEFVYRNRVRYRLLFNYPLGKKEMGPDTFFISAYDEVFIQFGPNFDRNYFDQNRLYGAFGYQYSARGNVQLGYMNQFIVKGDGLRAERNHTLQISLTYNADFRRNKG